jgi:PHD/YefM family antitoxin component YafN of YafNO toxin-antitoxin module
MAMNSTPHTATTTEIRRDFVSVLDKVTAGHHVAIMNYRRPAGVMVPNEWYEQALKLMATAGFNA